MARCTLTLIGGALFWWTFFFRGSIVYVFLFLSSFFSKHQLHLAKTVNLVTLFLAPLTEYTKYNIFLFLYVFFSNFSVCFGILIDCEWMMEMPLSWRDKWPKSWMWQRVVLTFFVVENEMGKDKRKWDNSPFNLFSGVWFDVLGNAGAMLGQCWGLKGRQKNNAAEHNFCNWNRFC